MRLRRMTAAELSAKSGLAKSSVSRYLSGENIPRSIAIGKMATALNVSPAWILGYNLTIDGKATFDMFYGDVAEITRSTLLTKLVRIKSGGFYSKIRAKKFI